MFNPWVGKIHFRRKWQPPPVFLPGESNGQRSLVGCSPWGRKELDTTESLNHYHHAVGRGFYSHAEVTVFCPLYRHVFRSLVPLEWLYHLFELPALPSSFRSMYVLPVFHHLM